MDQQVNVYLCVCMSFQVLAQLGGCTNSSRKGKNWMRGAVTKHLSDLLVLGG